MNHKHRNPRTKQPTAATPEMTAIIVMLRSSSLSLSASLPLWASLLAGLYSLEGVTVVESGFVVTELSVELFVILGVSGEGFAETALVLFRLLYGALQKQWSSKKLLTQYPLDCSQSLLFFRFRKRSARAHEGGETRETAASPVWRLQSRAYAFACLAHFAWQTKKKERLLVV